jgi:hypothetical protein
MKKIVAFAGFALLSVGAFAQTDLQVFYDFGKDRKHVTTTLEMFKADDWGSTFFFVDYDYTDKTSYDAGSRGARSTYMEIERALNFWQDTQLGALSAHVEFNAGIGFRNWLFGAEYFLHNADFSNTFTIDLLYKVFSYDDASDLPLQITGVWGMNNLFGVEGLRFSGFFDFWGEKATWGADDKTKFKFLSEPQLWYNVGALFGCENFNIGGEVELSNNMYDKGFVCNPCLGVKWNF